VTRRSSFRVAGTSGYGKETAQDVMPGAIEKCFGQRLPSEPLEWLTDNISAYRAHETRAFARMALIHLAVAFSYYNEPIDSANTVQRQGFRNTRRHFQKR